MTQGLTGAPNHKRKTLTDIGIGNLKPGTDRREIADGHGLYLVIQPSGAKSFAVRYRLHGRPQKLTLGPWRSPPKDLDPKHKKPAPKIGDPISLADARLLASETLRQVNHGVDPGASKRRAKQDQMLAAANTFKVVAMEYLKRICGMKEDADGNPVFDAAAKKKMRSGPDRYATLKRSVFPEIGVDPIGDIKKSRIVKLLDTIEDESGPVMADRTLALIRTIMNWHATRDDDFRSPIVRGMARTKPKERARKRILADDEIRDIWGALEEAEVPASYPPFIKSLLLCAARRNESAHLSSAEIDSDIWTIPGERYKTKLDHVVPLSVLAKALIGDKPADFKGNSWFIFSTTGGSKPFSGFSKAKKALDAKVAERRKAEDRPAMPRWTLHDLRRTARSLMSRAKVPADHAERCLGHVIGGVRETYDRYEYLEEKRSAFKALADLVKLILDPPKNNIVSIVERAGS